MMSEQGNLPPANAGNDPLQRKRVRAGSISGRLRTASDLEEIGMIDKYQKGYIKDLIISGDAAFQNVLEKYEKGDKKELEDLIRSGQLGRKQSIDILDDLDFDFLNGMKNDLDGNDAFEDDFMFDFADAPGGGSGHNGGGQGHGAQGGTQGGHHKLRTSSVDSQGSFSFFENLPYDANNANSLMDELQYLNRQYGDTPTADVLGGYPARLISPRNRPDAAKSNNAGLGGPQSTAANTGAGAPHVSFNRYMSSIDGTGDGVTSTLSGHKGRRDSWDIAAQYIQHEEDLVRGHGGSAGANRTGAAAPGLSWTQQQQQQQAQRAGALAGAGQAGTGAKANSGARKTNIKSEGVGGAGGGNIRTSVSAGGAGGLNRNGPAASGFLSSTGTGGSSSGAGGSSGGGSSGLRTLGTTGGTSTSTQHSAYNTASASYLQSGGGALNTSGSAAAYEEMAQRIGGAGYVGAYSPEQRRQRIEKFIEKRGRRVWTKKVKYDVRKNFADSRLRVKGRFVKKEDEDIMREILSI